jgi:CubicO group peptidase (beta-lactamase class C family)
MIDTDSGTEGARPCQPGGTASAGSACRLGQGFRDTLIWLCLCIPGPALAAELQPDASFKPAAQTPSTPANTASPYVSAPKSEAAPCTFADARQRFSQLITSQGLPGGGLLVGDRLGLRTEQYLGSYGSNTVIPIASASKLLGAVRILQLADRGAVDLDAPVSTYLPQFTGEKGTMTLRQMFSHTAGYGDDSFAPPLVNPNLTLAEAVNQIACCRPLNAGYTVGGQYSYGGVSMHIGGRVAEVRGGGDWQARWQAEIGAPLGISTIDWQGFGPTANYGIAASGRSNLRDYGRVLAMLANAGRGNGVQVLRPRSVAELELDRVGNLPIAYAPPNVTPPVRYGLGSWHDNQRSPPQRPLIHSLGGAGFFPWLDFDRGLYGVFMIQGGTSINSVALAVYTAMLQSIANDLDGGTCGYSERFEEILVDGLEG